MPATPHTTAAAPGTAPAPVATAPAAVAPSLSSLPLARLVPVVAALGQPAFRAGQLFSWMHQKNARSFGEMTNLPAALRQCLAAEHTLDVPTVARCLRSPADGTVKLLLRLADGHCVETVLMHHHHGHTVCVSSQVGCRMGCRFCASAPGGLARQLSAGEMAAQLAAADAQLPAGQRVGNVVLMGIGEPLDNYDNVLDFIRIITDKAGRGLSARGISLSTCGVVPGIVRLAGEGLPLTLSLSLHASSDAARSRIMPVNRRWPLAEVLAACRQYRQATGRRVSYEYAVIAGENDTDADAARLAELLHGTDGHVNLIPVNPVPGAAFAQSRRTAAFAAQLAAHGVNATVRRTLGADIDAACGQLRMGTAAEAAE